MSHERAERTATEAPVTVAHYYAGLVGSALLRRWYESGADNDERLAELRSTLDTLDAFPFDLELTPAEQSVAGGYDQWAAEYDGANPMIDAEETVLGPWIADAVETAHRTAAPGGAPVRALDAGCGTGRHAVALEAAGCHVTAVDATAAMLDVARTKLSDRATVVEGDLTRLPLDDDSVDLATSSLAICHLPSPEPAIAELARVVRPGGAILISDPHPTSGLLGGQAFFGGFEGGMRFVRNHYAPISAWISAFTAHGVAIDECVELPYDDAVLASNPLRPLNPEVLDLAVKDTPFILAWRLRVIGDDAAQRPAAP